MDWERGITARYRMFAVSPSTWRDEEELELISGTIDRTTEDLRESGTIEMTEDIGESFVRIYLEASQGGSSERIALFTGISSTPERSLSDGVTTYNVDLYSVLKVPSDVLLQRGTYIPAGIGIEYAAELLKGKAPVTYEESSVTLASALIAEDGETELSMALKLIDALGYSLKVSGDGTISIAQASAETVAKYDATSYDVIETEVTDTQDLFSVPNVYRVTLDDATAVARDDSENSPLSTVSRGREVWAEETDITLSTGETLADAALRLLKEAQAISRTLSYTRRFTPDVGVGDIVRIHYPAQNIDGLFRVTSQSLELSGACRTSEEVESYE